MSNRRNLKKYINDSMGLLYSDCLFYNVFVIDADKDACEALMHEIAESHSDLIKRVSVNEGKEVKGRVKAYYKKLHNDVKEQVDTFGKKISALG